MVLYWEYLLVSTPITGITEEIFVIFVYILTNCKNKVLFMNLDTNLSKLY